MLCPRLVGKTTSGRPLRHVTVPRTVSAILGLQIRRPQSGQAFVEDVCVAVYSPCAIFACGQHDEPFPFRVRNRHNDRADPRCTEPAPSLPRTRSTLLRFLLPIRVVLAPEDVSQFACELFDQLRFALAIGAVTTVLGNQSCATD